MAMAREVMQDSSVSSNPLVMDVTTEGFDGSIDATPGFAPVAVTGQNSPACEKHEPASDLRQSARRCRSDRN